MILDNVVVPIPPLEIDNVPNVTNVLLSVLGFLFTRKTNFLIIGTITLAIIVSLYKFRKNNIVKNLVKP